MLRRCAQVPKVHSCGVVVSDTAGNRGPVKIITIIIRDNNF